METVHCDFCHCNESQLIYQVSDTNYGTPGTFNLVRCNKCSLVYMNPRPTEDEIGNYYPSTTYHPFRAVQEKEDRESNPVYVQRATKIRFLHDSQTGDLLDVGCGSGLFMLAMKEQEWAVYGVEPNETASNFARDTLGLDIITGDIFDVPQDNTYAAISFWDVLEHTHSPQKVLKRANALLEANGLLAINVPNWASWERKFFKSKWIALDAPRHLYHFSPATLQNMLEKCGFEVVSLQTKALVMSPASNILRAFGDTAFRGGQTKSSITSEAEANTAVSPPASIPSFVKKIVIRMTYWGMTIPNFIANSFGYGGTLTIYARKKDSS